MAFVTNCHSPFLRKLCVLFEVSIQFLNDIFNKASFLYCCHENVAYYSKIRVMKNNHCFSFSFQACSSEVMMFRMARRYDAETDSILFATNQPYTRESYTVAGMGDTVEDLLRFCRHMCAMKVDNAEYALLTAIVIFSG